MEELFVKTTFNHSVSIEPSDINNKIEQTLITKIKNELEGKCNNNGYIKENSIKILSRSLGKIMSSHFTGSIIYNLKISADICNPLENLLIDARIININKMGVLAHSGVGDPPCLTILLAKQHHIDNQEFDNLQINQMIKVKVIGKRFEYGDKQISIIALLENTKSSVQQKPKEEILVSAKSEVEPVASGVQNVIYYNNKDNKWLSRSYNDNKFTYKGRLYDSIEHAFQAQKVVLESSKEHENYVNMLVADSNNYIGNKSSEAIKLGTASYFKKNGLVMREDWNKIRRTLLKDITRTYLQENKSVLERLIKTGSDVLINKGGKIDTYWGVNKDCNGENENGKIMMELRNELSI